tara:strand:- start:701 stop:1321 length:621 start_codon:yes stop_codon:yes gene_type:complete
MLNDISNVFYINLEDRKDRKINVENQLNSLGFNYTRFNAIKHNSGRIGCSLSHLNVLQIAQKQKLPYVIIVEDDIHFTQIDIFKKQLNDFLNSGIDYDVYLLAGNIIIPPSEVSNGIFKIKACLTTTGYIVKEHYYDVLINNIKEGISKLSKNPKNGYNAIDVYWINLQKKDNWYISKPRTITQLPDYSDIERRRVKYNHYMLDKI